MTVTCRQGSSRAERGLRRGVRALALAIAWLVLVAGARDSLAGELQLDLGRLAHPAFVIDGLKIEIGAEGAAARVAIARLTVGERRWEGLALRCPDFHLDAGVLRCRGGTLQAPGLLGRTRVDAEIDPARRTAEVTLDNDAGERIRLVAARDGRLRIEMVAVALANLSRWIPELSVWKPDGRFDGHVDYFPPAHGGRVRLAGRVSDAGFAGADGLHAGEQLEFGLELDATARGDGWAWQGRLDWTAGEAYLHPLYLVAGPVLDAAGTLDAGTLAISRATLALEGVRAVSATAEFDLARGRLRRAALAAAGADLALIGPRYLAPILLPARVDALTFGGRMSAGIEFEGDVPVALDVAFDEATIGLASGEFEVGPVSGSLPWRADTPTDARLAFAGGRWQKLAFKPFELAARLHGRSVDVERVAVPVLDGALVLEGVSMRHGASGWYGSGGVVVEPISMDLLTEAVGLPAMSGVLSASLPGLRVAPGEIVLDGALVISVFDGYVRAINLRILEPFGVAAHLYADVEARRIDLAQLTATFSFGSVTGYIDADVHGLELARWRPVRFDARVASSPGRYPRRVSQRAVQNISALGGAGAVAAIQRSFLGFFETFGYREIGLSCALSNGVCRMGGLEGDEDTRDDAGFVLVRGGGIPALNVIGYNRRVDWNELVDRLQRVIASNAPPVIR